MQVDADALAAWLITLGYPDYRAAHSAAQRLTPVKLQPVWELLQTRLLSPAGSKELDQALQQSSRVSPKLQELQWKRKHLEQQILQCKQQIHSEQV